jgi:hypothetical protein
MGESVKRAPVKRLTRAQIKETLASTPIESILGVKQPLTNKQREYARKLAEGTMSKRQAYKSTYNAQSAYTLASDPYKLASDPRVIHEIQAYRLALEAEKLRTPRELKALLIHQLVKHSIDEDFPPAQRIKALELIGKLYEVGAFMERKETTITHVKSGDLKAQLLERIKAVVDVDAKPSRSGGASLLAEISEGRDPTGGAHPAQASEAGGDPTHTIPLAQSLENTVDTPQLPSTEPPPSPFET